MSSARNLSAPSSSAAQVHSKTWNAVLITGGRLGSEGSAWPGSISNLRSPIFSEEGPGNPRRTASLKLSRSSGMKLRAHLCVRSRFAQVLDVLRHSKSIA